MTINLFLESIKSPKTREGYSDALRRFCAWAGISEGKLAKTRDKTIQIKLIEYIVALKKEGKSYSSQNVVISAVKKFCEAYDIEDVNFSKVYNYMGEHTTNNDDKPYSKEQIAKMLDAADARVKAIILLLVSTGIRIGAVSGMLIRDLTKIEDKGLYKVVVYANSPKDRYFTFTTPEAAQAIDAYLEQRKVAGETIKPTAPLFRQTFPKSEANNPKPMKFDGLAGITQRIMVKSGVRVVAAKRNVRHQTAINHGFRKLFNTALVKAGLKPVVVEVLTGHDIGLQKNYLRLEETDVLAEYLKAIDLLTISEERKLQEEVAKLKTEVSDIETMKKSYLDIKLQLEKERAERERLYGILYASGIIKPEQKA